MKQRVLPEDHPDIAKSMNNLANAYDALGDHAAARDLHKQALEMRQRVLPEDHTDIADSMSNLASAYYALGDHAAARDMFRRARRVVRG